MITKVAVWFVPVMSVVLAARGVVLGEDGSWGDLRGRFVYDGEPPREEAIIIERDADGLGDSIPDESLVVNARDRGLANVFVYLLPEKGVELPVHASYAESADDKVELLMEEGRFKPHALLLRTTQTMVNVNGDSIAYSPRMSRLTYEPM